ncbi:MAG: hypothetical protein KF749_00800 [Bacteroidetes bacterium]|nr:hypothetical protein [Bacteroidota bacterium]MCW5895167.1 hypothetical protein [Bacteroidota bacterium]
MKLRRSKIEITDSAEHEAEAAVRRLASEATESGMSIPSSTHFANLIVRTNHRIDHVTSGAALSISWLARVAVPGVVAILFFFIGLHYYGPGSNSRQSSMAEVVRALPAGVIDSLLYESSAASGSIASEIPGDVLGVSNVQLAEFYFASGMPASILETLPQQQVTEVAAILESRSTDL